MAADVGESALPRRSAMPCSTASRHGCATSCAVDRYWSSASLCRPRDAAYFEIVQLTDLDNTLRVLGFTLFGASLLTTLAGAGMGLWASRRTLRPLADVSEAATAIAGGRLDTAAAGRRRPRPRCSRDVVQRDGARPPTTGRTRCPLRLGCQPRAAVATHDAVGGRRDPRDPARRAPRTGGGRRRPPRRRGGAVPAAGRGPPRDLPVRRRRPAPRARPGAPGRVRAPGGRSVIVADSARRGRRRARRRRGGSRQAPPGPGARQPARQRPEVRRRCSPRCRCAGSTTGFTSPSRTPDPASRPTTGP